MSCSLYGPPRSKAGGEMLEQKHIQAAFTDTCRYTDSHRTPKIHNVTKPWPLFSYDCGENRAIFCQREELVFILLQRSKSTILFLLLSPPTHRPFIKGNIYLDIWGWHQFFWLGTRDKQWWKTRRKTEFCSAIKFYGRWRCKMFLVTLWPSK